MKRPASLHRLRNLALAIVATMSLALASALLGAPAHAQSELMLTDQQITGFITSYPDVQALAEELEGEAPEAGDDLAASLGALATYRDAMTRLNATVAAHGFADYAEWLQVTSAISLAYVYARDGGAMDAQMQAAIAQIEANPSLSDEQKAMVVEQMRAASGAIDDQRPPQPNIDAVNARADELATIFDDM